MKTEIFTDGGCIGNPGPGAWAFVIDLPDSPIEDSGFDPDTTNNRMELQAVIRALDYCRVHQIDQVRIHTDSQYVKNGISDWIHNWKRRGWLTAAKKPVKNRDLWMTLDEVNGHVQPEWRWVKGHAGIELNERCDQLVQQCIAANR
ncbi:ribonuclease HI [Salinispira pacifica]|uniref:Ribonuclease H n=1 Tax=Salinispira pacifica TaxID=1307761 RepID=V5WFI4_9SPIO|nr:ribonuclease HI [Salinispira pacifica]AHC14324.1 Ribonuclease HI [Salinispira pacifica]